ncbi:MAG: DUF58 domain-containing protein [Acidobacteriaceae bacterium]|nr:DUF58 domain-containing protein [Acidobacteriaceae bacterium]
MSFAPSSRLLWLVALVVLPACALPAIAPHGERYLVLVVLVGAIICCFDLIASRHLLNSVSASLPETVRATLNESKGVVANVHRDAGSPRAPRRIRIAAAFPAQLESLCDDVVTRVPDRNHTAQIEFSILGRERGNFRVTETLLGCASRLGLWDLRRSIPVDCNILVEPALADISKQVAKMLASHRHGGQRIVARNGRGREFEQLREYVPHDDFADIDWKATARKQRPIVREYQIERTQDIYACVDSSRLSAQSVTRPDDTRVTILDEYVRSTLMLHRTVRETGDRFGFATFNNRVAYFVKATHAASFDPVFRRALYPLRPAPVAPGYDEMCSTLRTRAKRRALVVFFTSLAEPQLAESFLEASYLLRRQHLVVIASPMDAHVKPLFTDENVSDVEDIYGQLAGHLLWKKLSELRSKLAAVGIRMHNVAPARLGLVAATEYLDVKERQLL